MKKKKEKSKLLISACLFGENSRYDGKNNKLSNEEFHKLTQKYELISFCPEVEGGLPTPRNPNEIDNNYQTLKLHTKDGIDNTKFFVSGANKCLKLMQEKDIKIALLKSKSPSCSTKQIYDGSFSKTLIDGMGVTAKLLSQNDIEMFDEHEIELLCKN
jgi:uncharacterized protein YbbK (DUF523 family)